MLPPHKVKVVLCLAALACMVVVSIFTSLTTPSVQHMIKSRYDALSRIHHPVFLKGMASSTAHSPVIHPTRSNSTMMLTSNDEVNASEFMNIQADIQRRRRKHLADVCSANGVHEVAGSQDSHFIVDEKYKLVYCYVPKVACTSWKRVFLVLNGVMKRPDDLPQTQVNNVIGPRKLSFLSSYNKSKRAEILKSYTKFLVVRHPFHRVLSAFQNKLWAGSTSKTSIIFQKKIGLHILEGYRTSTLLNNKSGSVEQKTIVNKHGDEIKYDLRFDEFVKFLTTKTEKPSLLKNSHWGEITHRCKPCDIDYDVISHFETLVDDALYILRRVHADHVVKFPSSNGSSPTNSSSKSLYQSYYADIPQDDLHKLYQRYRLDFELFGYEKPDSVL
ncbi:carbohydrate sulfotransferase 11-like [Lytechinus variegatus]|uniref:carbohydrate sulfotransferase 11-like n=1 Tax=Lytechinus variegatus TaxID=7654 RepID=UPI001BB1A6A6|nr:carbohydrate sulfotransferase 11-like [Lytechinus variegatus]